MNRKELNERARDWYRRNREVVGLQRKHRRREAVAQMILLDARRSDRRRKRTNDLDLEFVSQMIRKPCGYCGETAIRKTLDRIDNSLGHVRSNVVVACERCNLVRRNMPFDAWVVVARSMRRARTLELFGDWTGAIHRREALAPIPVRPPKPSAPHGTLAGYHDCGPPRCQCCKDAMAAWKRGRR